MKVSVCFQPQSDGTAGLHTHTHSAHSAHTHTQEGGLLTQKSAYSPESVFPEALLHVKTGRVQREAWPWSLVFGPRSLDPGS